MFPVSFRANRFAACSVFLKTYDVVWYMGTARAPVAGSGVSCPACSAMVSSFCLTNLGSPLLFPLVGHEHCIRVLYVFLRVLFQKEY